VFGIVPDSSETEQILVQRSCKKESNELLRSMNVGKFIDQMSDYYLHEKDSIS
jgi:hypothetical protein